VQNLTFIPALIVRSPLYSFTDYYPSKLKSLLSDPYFILGVYLASPTLFKIIENANYDITRLNKNQQLSLLKYVNRMHYRPTPFGNFSSFSVTQWGAKSNLCLAGLPDLNFYTDWDQEVILKLSLAYIADHWRETQLQINHTLYIVKDDYRFVRTHFDFEKRVISFSLEALTIDNTLKEVLKLIEQPITGEQLLEKMYTLLDFTLPEAYDYLLCLLDIQIILPDAHPSVIGTNNKVLAPCQFLQNDMPANAHEKLRLHEHELQTKFGLQHLDMPQHTFYINTKRPANGSLNNQYQAQLMQALQFLSQALPVQLPSALKTFTEAFKARYDQEEMPLLEVLDPEIGVGYSDLAIKSTSSELIADLDFPSHESVSHNLNWLNIHRTILNKWNNSTGEIPEIILDHNDLATEDQRKNKTSLPPSIAVMFRVLDDQLLLESAGGVTGTALIGRFAAFDKEVKTIAEQLVTDEQHTNPNVIFAEIGQLSGMHIDNVNRRAHLYNYEIPINVISSLPAENQIRLNDLYLSIKQDRLLLKSKSLEKEVIPRLTSAYNYIHNDLAIFRFLCDMQHQGLQSNFSFNLENFFPGLSFYPRIKIGSVIISPAKWILNEQEIASLSKSVVNFKTFSRQKKWPQYIAISKNDQQLIFNIKQDAEIDLFRACVLGAKTIQICEYPLPNRQLILNTDDKPMVNQFVAFLKNSMPSYNAAISETHNKPAEVARAYPLGSEWIYLKIYCHEQSANNLIGQIVLPLLEDYEPHLINKWFFIRYQDPRPHIRLRMHVKAKHIGQILAKFNKRLSDAIQCKIIHDYQSDIYRRELERYNPFLMESVESAFHNSSKLVCRYLVNIESALSEVNYHSLALVSTWDIIQLFHDFIGDGLSFTDTIAKSLYQEFAQNKALKITLDQKYRSTRPELEQLLNNTDYYSQLHLLPEFTSFANSCMTLKRKAESLTQQAKISLVADIIHMHLNRIFFEHARKQELCIYHMLNKYIAAQLAIKRSQIVYQ
jgi:thiopeptide-type bacteriocin biosynthesis protein